MFYFLPKVGEIIITSSASLAAMWSGKVPYAQHSDCCRQEAGGTIYYLSNQFKYCLSFRKCISSLYREICTGLIRQPPLVKFIFYLNSQYSACTAYGARSKDLALGAALCSRAALSITISCRGCSSSTQITTVFF